MRKLTFLFDVPLLKNDVKKFSFEELLELNADVTLIDLSPYLNPSVNESITAERFADDRFHYQMMTKFSEIEKYMEERRDDFYFPMFDNYYETRNMFSLFTKYGITYGHVNNAMTDMVLPAEVEKAEDYAAYHTFEHYKKAIYHRAGRRLRHLKPAEFQVFGGHAGEDSHFRNAECKEGYTKRVYLWTYNYEAYRRVEPYDNGGRPYAMMIDQYTPFHPDAVVLRGAKIDPEVYYDEICQVLDYVRERYDMDVIVAAHPKADYKGRERYYRGCKILYGKSAELARGCKMFFGNSSGANAYAAFDHKPITLINMSATQGYAHSSNLCEAYAKMLGCNVIREEEDIKKTDYYYINESVYDEFWKQYVMSAKEDNGKTYWANVLNEVEKIK